MPKGREGAGFTSLGSSLYLQGGVLNSIGTLQRNIEAWAMSTYSSLLASGETLAFTVGEREKEAVEWNAKLEG